MMKKLAVVFEDSIFDRKGAFRAKMERARNLALLKSAQVDIWCIQTSYTWVERLLLGQRFFDGVPESRLGRPKELVIDGLKLNMIWMDYSILDHFLFFKLKLRPLLYPRFLRRQAPLFAEYDLISAHAFEGGFLAREVNKRYGVPYCVTWHGSDIHTKPFKYPCIRQLTAELMAGAKMNFFVSKALMDTSDEIGSGNKLVVYNGCGKAFYRFDEAKRQELRKKYQLDGSPVVGFVGNLEHIKNVAILPSLFAGIQKYYGAPVTCWIIGDGRERASIQAAMQGTCRFFGNLPPESMPEIYNCLDLLVLPSLNEGLPLVILEALSCGCRAVGSKVGGIPEVLDEAHCVALGEDFTDRFSRVAAAALSAPFSQSIPAGLSWEETARKEFTIFAQSWQ